MKKILRNFFIILLVFSLIPFACKKGDSSGDGGAFSDVSIVFFPGGNEGGTFASIVYRGAKLAEEELGCKVDYVWSGWAPEKMIAQFKDAVAKKPDGIAIMGHPGDDAYLPLVEEAINKGIIVTSQNANLPINEGKFSSVGFGYVGQELYPSGYTLGKGAAERAGLKKGDRAMVWGLLAQGNRGKRTKGSIDALEDMGIIVDYIEISDEINADATLGNPVVASYVAANPDVKMIIADHGALTASLGSYLKGANKKPGEIFGAGFDLSSATADAIKEGWVGAVLDQQPFLQGFLPIVQICLTKKFGFAGLHIDTGSAIIDETNIDMVAPLAEEGVR
jgi:simple sugar transport system substrate-binding protein